MPGVIAAVGSDWLEVVRREAAHRFALGRLDRAKPGWTQPGDPWFLLSGTSVVGHAAFVEQEMLTPDEAFDQFAYGTGALSVEGACAALGASEDELVSWIALEGLTGLRHAWTVKDLNGIGVTLDGSGLTRLTAEQTEGLLADSSG